MYLKDKTLYYATENLKEKKNSYIYIPHNIAENPYQSCLIPEKTLWILYETVFSYLGRMYKILSRRYEILSHTYDILSRTYQIISQ